MRSNSAFDQSEVRTTGFYRLWQIIGDRSVEPPVPAIIPVSKSSWWAGVKAGRYPKPVKIGPHTTAWRIEDIHALVARLSANVNSTV